VEEAYENTRIRFYRYVDHFKEETFTGKENLVNKF